MRPGKGLLSVLLASSLALPLAAEAPSVQLDKWPDVRLPFAKDPELEGRIDAILARMTLAEKVGQVIQPDVRRVSAAEIREYHIGSVLNGGGGFPNDDKNASVADWLALADAAWEASVDTSDGGVAIPITWGVDAVHGHNNVIGATLFPHNIGLGAANDPELMRRIGEITAREVRVTGHDWNFAPTVAVPRNDRWGRTYEGYSEDPEIVARLAPELVKGLQGEVGSEDFLGPERVVSTVKHYLGDGGTEDGRNEGDNLSTEEELRDIHAAGYVPSLEAGALAVMASFNSWHGTKMHGNRDLLTTLLKEKWGFDGLVVGDWNGHGQLPGCNVTSCPDVINAGLDMYMVPNDWKALYESTLDQAESGVIPSDRLDDAVRRILRVKMRAGLFEAGKPSTRPLAGDESVLGSPEHRSVAREAVRKSLVLLKNEDGLLPLARKQHVLVAGDGAHDVGKQSGGWTITWLGAGTERADYPNATTIWEAIDEAVTGAGGTATLAIDGTFDEEKKPDVAIVVYGENPYAEGVGDRPHVDYQPGGRTDLEMLQRLGEAGIPVVSVFLSGRPLWVNPEINASQAFVAAWLPGSEGAGVTDVLFRAPDGSINHDFHGRLSFSWPKTAAQTEVNQGDADYDPQFAYGYGLSYAQPGEVAVLPEERGIAPAPPAPTVYFDGAPTEPLMLLLYVPNVYPIPVGTARAETAGGELVVRNIDRRVQEDARAASWSGAGEAYLLLTGPMEFQGFDMSSRAAEGNALAVDFRVDEAPRGDVVLAMACGMTCRGVTQIAGVLGELPLGEWRTVRIPLACFRDAGADLSRITAPMVLGTGGSLGLSFSDVRLVPADDGPTVCPSGP
jgi:beta-glucosidase